MKRETWEGLAIAALGLLLWLGLAGTHPVPPGHVVDPGVTPPDVRPEWYFLALYTLLRYVPEHIGVLIPGFLFAALVVIPYVAPTARGFRHRVVQLVTVLGVIAYFTLTVLGITGGGGP